MAAGVITLELGDNKVVIHEFGATVTSWICNGRERLFVSSKAVYDNKKAIRGGIPVVFPNFGPWKLGPQHGFARISKWKLLEKRESEEKASATFSLTNTEQTEAMWKYKFSLRYTVELSRDGSLGCSLCVTNNDTEAFDFTALLHTYLRVDDVYTTTVSNLKGLKYNDKLRNGEEFTEDNQLVTVVDGADRVYKSTSDTHEVTGCVNGSKVLVTKANLPDTVVWNPWVENAKNMSDFDDEGYKVMICVEPGYVAERCILEPNANQFFVQKLKIVS